MKDIQKIHNQFLLLARNRSDFNKIKSQNKYRNRENHVEKTKYPLKLKFLDLFQK